MSAVSGLTSKGENKSKQKYQSLNINNLYKGKSLENPKTSVAPKHGLQTLGKVGAGRRMPPPANLPSLKSQNSGPNNPNINLVPTGGQGWGSGKEEDSGATPPSQTSSSGQQEITQQASQKMIISQSSQLITSSSVTTDSSVGVIASGVTSAGLTAASKTWSNITAIPSEECGPEKSFLAQQSPFFPQEFPKLAGGGAPPDAIQKANTEQSYGPGPALRPATEGSWGRGTLPQPGFNQSANLQPNPGNGVLGQQTSSPPLQTDPNVQNLQQVSRGIYPQPVSGLPQQRAPIPGSVALIPTGNQTAGPPLIPGQQMNAIQYRMMSQYMYPRGAYPSGAFPPQAYPHPPPPTGALPAARPPYFPDARVRQRLDDETGLRPSGPAPPIISDKDLKGFDEILENDVQAGWAAANSEIDYNAKLVFSDDEDSAPAKELTYDEQRDRTDSKPKSREDWEQRDYDKDERTKYRAPQPQWHQQQQHLPPNARVGNYDYSQHPQQGQTPIPASYQRPQQIHTNYPHSRQGRSEMVADEDEMWRQRSRQQSDEMAAAVIRARQRREEDEKKIERSRQAAHEKLKALEEKASLVEKDKELEIDERSRHSSESRDEKLSNRDSRDMRSSNYSNSFAVPKQYPKNVPPRFQKQAELMRQQQTSQTAQSPPYDQRLTHPLSRLSQDNDQRANVSNQLSNASQLSNKAPLIADSSRSDSQISSGHESYDSERERQTPEYDSISSKDKRQKQSGFDNSNWRSMQTQRPPANDSKDSSDNCRPNESYDSDKTNQSSQRDLSKRLNEESAQTVTKSDYSTQKNRPEIRDTKLRDDTIDSKESVEKRSLIERQESSQSSQSDSKRSSSSKDDRFVKKYERLDWATECDNVSSITSYGKRDRHRHVPITQKQFESINEPIKKNFTPLKKINSSAPTSATDDSKDSSVDKTKDTFKKSQTPPPPNQSVSAENNATQATKNVTDASKVQTVKEETQVEVSSKKERDSEKQNERGYNRDREGSRKDSAKEDKSVRKSNSNRYDSYQGRGRYSGATYRGRGREYRRTRGSSEKSSYSESKLPPSPGRSRNKNNKSRRKSNSDESFVSEEQNKKESIKAESDKSLSSSISTSVTKEAKQEDDKEKDKISVTEPIISTSVLPTQRNDPSRRGRGVVAFKNNTRVLPRSYGPSNYGPPPSRAAFGDGTVKSDVPRNFDQNRNERNDSRNSNEFQTRVNSSKSYKNEINPASYSHSQSNRVSHDNNRNSISHGRKGVNSGNRGSHSTGSSTGNNRSEQLPPRFQKRHNAGSQRGGRGRNWNERSGSSNANQVESDVTNNEEWETASESSDIAERNDRKSNKKSNSEARNDNRNHSRRSDGKRSDYSRGQHNTGSQSSNYRGRNRNSGTNSVSSGRGANANSISANQQRNGPLSNSNINDNITVCSLSDVTLDNPTAVENALTDIKSRTKSLSNDYIDDHLNNSETEDGFQTVSYKKRNKVNQGNNTKKLKQETSPSTKLAARNQRKLAPRFAKQKENNRLNKISNEMFKKTANNLSEEIKSLSIESKYTESSDRNSKERVETSSKTMPNAWSRPLSHSSTATASNTTVTTNTKADVKTTNSITHDIQALSISSKSSSFDQHDSGIDVSDQPPSTASSQRSSPSNDDNKLITTTAKVNPAIDSHADIVSDIDTAKPMCTVIFENSKRFKEENRVLAKIQPSKSPSAKEMLINNTTLSNNVVTETSRASQAINTSKKSDAVLLEEFPITEKTQSPNVAKVVGMQRPNVLPTDDLNMKIASVKKVWENTPSMTPVIEQTSENSKNALLNSLEENKIKANVSHSSDGINNAKVSKGFQSQQTSHKGDYSNVDSMNALNKDKQQQGMSYTTPNQVSPQPRVSPHQTQASIISSQQVMLNPLSSPPLDSIRSLSGVQTTFQVHNMSTTPAISSPPTMLYNTQVAAHNVYQTFGPQIETLHQSQMPAVMTQFGPQPASGHYGQQHLLQQQNPLNQANLFMAAHQLAAQPSATPDQYKFNQVAAHQQTLANSILKSQFVHQNNSTLQHTLTTPASWTAASGHTPANTQTANYYPQSSSVGTALQPHQQHFAFQSQPSIGLMSAQPSQPAIVQQSYRATPVPIGRATTVDQTANTMAANIRNMFSGNIPINEMKIATSVHQTLDARNANNRTSFTYTQAPNLQQLQQQQQQQIYANQQKYANRAIHPLYQQMLGQSFTARPNTGSVLSSNVSSANSYTTPIQRPSNLLKANRNNQSYTKSSHQQQHYQQHQQQTHAATQQTVSSRMTTAQKEKMRQEAVLQTQSFFAQSSLPLNKIESQTSEPQSEASTNDSVTPETSVNSITDDKSKPSNDSTEKND